MHARIFLSQQEVQSLLLKLKVNITVTNSRDNATSIALGTKKKIGITVLIARLHLELKRR